MTLKNGIAGRTRQRTRSSGTSAYIQMEITFADRMEQLNPSKLMELRVGDPGEIYTFLGIGILPKCNKA